MSAEAGAPPVGPVAESPSVPADSLSQPPESDAATVFLRRAQLAEDRLSEVLGAYRTLKKENEAHRERIARNLERRYENRRERLVVRFIEILDNLDRALEAAETSFASSALVEGLILVRTQLLHTLRDEGLERIPVLGLAYDPRHSEAVETVPVDDADAHHLVVKELLRGYRLHGRVARASRVVVGEYVEGGDAADAAGWQPPAPEPFAAPDSQPFAAPPAAHGFTPPPAQGRSDELTLEEIIARAEALDAHRQPASPPAAPPGDGPEEPEEAADSTRLPDHLGDDVLGYVGDDETEPEEDDRG